MSWITCNKLFRRKGGMSDSKRKKLSDRLRSAVASYESNPMFIKTKYANDTETMLWLWNKFTKKELDFDFNPIKMSDVRKFEHGIKWFEKNLTNKANGKGKFFDMFKVGDALTRKFPELQAFQENLSQETGHYRNVTIKGSQLSDEIVKGWVHLAKQKGGDVKKLRLLEGNLEKELSKPKNLQDKTYINTTEKEIQKFLNEESSSRIFRDFNLVMNGLDVEQLNVGGGDRYVHDGKEYNKERYNSEDMKVWRTIDSNMKEMRTMGVKVLGQSINKVLATAKILDKREQGTRNLESTVRNAVDMIKRLEFQSEVDAGPGLTSKEMKWFDELSAFGFRKGEDAAIQKKYMPLYVIGATKLLRQMSLEMRKNTIDNSSLDQVLKDQIDGFRRTSTRILERGNIQDGRYTIDPAYFLKKYVHDVSTFNFTTHLENSYWKHAEKLLDMHAKAKHDNDKEVMNLSESLIKQMNEMKDVVTSVDPNNDTMINDLSRLMTSVTYLRLMGGNLRSALRNGTQRIYEVMEFGAGASWNARKWRKKAENQELVNKQAKRFGLSWYVNEGAGLLGRSRDLPIEQATRGAIAESNRVPEGMKINELGEMVKSDSAVRGITKGTADAASWVAGKLGKAHTIVEDWNRAGTFGTAFALQYQKMQVAPKPWLMKKMGWRKGQKTPSDDAIERFRQNKAGRMAYNLTTDLHFEYSKWAKSKAFGGASGMAGAAGQIGGQFMHYRLSMFNMMQRWVKEGLLSMKTGDFTSEEVWKLARAGMIFYLIEGMSMASNMNLSQLAQNDVVDTLEKTWNFFALDRDNPAEKKELDKELYGQGAWSFAGPNILYAANIGEAAGFWHLGENSYFKSQNIVEGNENFTRQQKWKSRALVNSQLARFSSYTMPLLVKRGFWDAARFELGLMPDKKWKNMRGWIGHNLKKETPYKLRKQVALTGIRKDIQRGFKDRSVLDTRDMLTDLDVLQGRITPSQSLNRRKRRTTRGGYKNQKNVMEALTFMESLP